MRHRAIAGAFGLGLGLALLVAVAGPAAAKLTGPCSGTGAFEKLGETIDPKTQDSATLPAKDSVAYHGEIATTETDRSHDGWIKLELPFPLPDVEVANWSTDSTDESTDDGTYDYDLPFIVPRGVTLNLVGEHHDTAGNCTGSMEITIDGGMFDAPVPVIAALFLTGLLGFGVFTAGRVR